MDGKPRTSGARGCPPEDGVRRLVPSFGEDGPIAEMQGCATRREAVEYAA